MKAVLQLLLVPTTAAEPRCGTGRWVNAQGVADWVFFVLEHQRWPR